MMRSLFLTAALAAPLSLGAQLTLPAMAHAASNDIVVESATSGGTAETATPYLDLFAAYAKTHLAGWKPIVMTFFQSPKPAEEAIFAKKPGFGMLDVELFLDVRKREEVVVLATAEGPLHSHGHMHLVVKDPAIKTLEDLKGKVLVSNHLQSPRYVSKVVFDGKIDVTTFFKLEPSASPMKGLKAVDRGEAAATMVDDQQLASMKTLPFGASLRTIFTSTALPPTPFVAFAKNATPEERIAMQKMVLGMCADAKGAEVCKALQITKFGKPDAKVWNDSMKRYDK